MGQMCFEDSTSKVNNTAIMWQTTSGSTNFSLKRLGIEKVNISEVAQVRVERKGGANGGGNGQEKKVVREGKRERRRERVREGGRELGMLVATVVSPDPFPNATLSLCGEGFPVSSRLC